MVTAAQGPAGAIKNLDILVRLPLFLLLQQQLQKIILEVMHGITLEVQLVVKVTVKMVVVDNGEAAMEAEHQEEEEEEKKKEEVVDYQWEVTGHKRGSSSECQAVC